MREQYMKTGQGFLLVYAANSRESFQEVQQFYHQILRVKDRDQVGVSRLTLGLRRRLIHVQYPCLLVANKCDLGHERVISKAEGLALAKHFGIGHIESSAKLRINVDECFYALVQECNECSNVPQKRRGKSIRGKTIPKPISQPAKTNAYLEICEVCGRTECDCEEDDIYEELDHSLSEGSLSGDDVVSLTAHLFSSDDDDILLLDTPETVVGFDADASLALVTVEDEDVADSLQSDEDSSSSDSSVYEEPEEEDHSDQEIMEDIVRERLLTGWEDSESEEEEEDLEKLLDAAQDNDELPAMDPDSEESESEEAILQQETWAIQSEVEQKINEGTMHVVDALDYGKEQDLPKRLGFEIKKSQVGPNGEITTTTKNIRWQTQKGGSDDSSKRKKAVPAAPSPLPSASPAAPVGNTPNSNAALQPFLPPFLSNNPATPSALPSWLALSAVKMNSSTPFAASRTHTPGLSPSVDPTSPISLLPITPTAPAVSHLASTPGVMQKPALPPHETLKVIADIKKMDIDTMLTIIDVHTKIKAAAQAAVAAQAEFGSYVHMAGAVEELNRLLGLQTAAPAADHIAYSASEDPQDKNDELALFEDIFDNGLFEENESQPSAVHDDEPDEIDFSRFNRIPIGTFWNSQRSRSKVAKKRDIQRAIKRSSDTRILDSTLLENMPKTSRSKKRSVHPLFFSPDLVAANPTVAETSSLPSKSLDYLQSDYSSIPPPFML
ncbi:Ras GTPase [Kappamyces sp. JEL0680]|nr:Ras GTPase [Kappamyces sp. JEL0680]